MKLGSLCEVVRGSSPRPRSDSRFYGGSVPRLMVADLTRDGKLVTPKIDSLTLEGAKQSRPMKRGDIVIAVSGDPGLPAILAVDACIHDGFVGLRQLDTSRVDPDFLYRFLVAEKNQNFSQAVGAIFKNLTTDQVKGINVPLPAMEQQRRIAIILDKVETLRTNRSQALAKLDGLTQSLFFEVFGERLTAPAIDTRRDRVKTPRRCSWVLLTDVAQLATGHTPDRERVDYWNGNIPWISLTDIRSLDGAEAMSTLQNVTGLGIKNSSSVLLPKGTVCFSRTASVGFVTVMGREMATSQDFMNWVCGPKLDPTYLMWALIASRQRLLALSSGSTHRTIYMRVVEQFRVLLPPIEQQREFALRVATVEKLKSVHRLAFAKLDALFLSLQHRAFGGNL